jgi:hypothetical protein
MKLVKMAWVLGGVAAFGLGVVAEGCSSTQSSDVTGGGNCATLDACCPKLTGANLTSCTSLVTAANDTNCASFLAESGSSCATPGSGTSTTPGSGTSTTPGSGTSVTPGSGTSGTPGSGTSVTPTDAGTGADCEAPTPSTDLYPETKAGVYCPFSKVDGGKNLTCTAGQDCCEPPEGMGASTCVAGGSTCPVAMSTDWECEGAEDCAGSVCCGTGTIETQVACGAYPAYPYISKFTGSSCAATCSTYQICSQTSECTSPKTCVAVEPKGNVIGVCQ